MFLDQVVLVSTVPCDNNNPISTANTYKHTPSNSRPTSKTSSSSSSSSSIAAGSESLGQIYQLELGGGETFGVKVTPFTYKDSSIPANCLTAFGCSGNSLAAYHPTLSALFIYAKGKDRPVSRSFGHERINALQATPCGRFLLAGTDTGSLILWRIGSGDLLAVIEAAHFQAIRVIRISPDGMTVATGSSDALIKIWSWNDLTGSIQSRPEPLYTFSQHSAPISDLVFSLSTIGKGRGRLLSAGLDGKCNFYDLVDGQLLLQLSLPESMAISSVALNATETVILAAGVNGNIFPFHLNGNLNPPLPIALQLHKGPVSSLQWSIDERVLISAGFEDGQVAFWDAQSHQLLKSVQLSSGKKVSCTNILISLKSDPVLFDSQKSSSTSQDIFNPFKRIGNRLTSVSTSAAILPAVSLNQTEINNESKEIMKELRKENEELRAINSELCSIICENDK